MKLYATIVIALLTSPAFSQINLPNTWIAHDSTTGILNGHKWTIDFGDTTTYNDDQSIIQFNINIKYQGKTPVRLEAADSSVVFKFDTGSIHACKDDWVGVGAKMYIDMYAQKTIMVLRFSGVLTNDGDTVCPALVDFMEQFIWVKNGEDISEKWWNWWKGTGDTINAVIDHESQKKSVYPNPASDQINILGLNGNVMICDIGGLVYYSGRDSSINVESLPEGMYFLRSGSDNIRFVIRR